jgi:hypothetical protein
MRFIPTPYVARRRPYGGHTYISSAHTVPQAHGVHEDRHAERHSGNEGTVTRIRGTQRHSRGTRPCKPPSGLRPAPATQQCAAPASTAVPGTYHGEHAVACESGSVFSKSHTPRSVAPVYLALCPYISGGPARPRSQLT